MNGAEIVINSTSSPTARIDVIWPRLIGIADEISHTLIRTAFSHDVIVAHDMSAAIFDDRGYMLAQTRLSATGHVGAMPFFVKELLRQVPASTMRVGDSFITNDPWLHSGHTADVFVASPAFHGGALVGFVVSCVHHVDIGGRKGSGASAEVYEEGLLLPILPLTRGSVENVDLFALIRRNVRFADKVIGDLRAQISAGYVGSQLMQDLLKAEGRAHLRDVADDIADRTERGMRNGISKLRDGSFADEVQVEIEGLEEPVRVAMTLTKNGDQIVADFSGSSPQVRRPINSPLNYTRAYLVVAIKMVCDPTLPNNDGSYRPIRILAPEGCVVNPTYPAAVFWRYATGLMVGELTFKLLAKFAPDRVPAGSGSMPTWQFYVSGREASGREFMIHTHAFGGMGARPGRDGIASVSFPYNVRDLPSEVIEAESPLMVVERELIPDSGGAGRWRGGLGERMIITSRPDRALDPAQPMVLSGGAGRMRWPAHGLLGGEPGSLARILVNGAPVPATSSPDIHFGSEDVVTLELPGGGGYGDPAQRQEAAAASDLANEYVTAKLSPPASQYIATEPAVTAGGSALRFRA